MPAKSKAQFRKIQELHDEGKLTDEQYHNYTDGVSYEALVERLKPKKRESTLKGGEKRKLRKRTSKMHR